MNVAFGCPGIVAQSCNEVVPFESPASVLEVKKASGVSEAINVLARSEVDDVKK